MEVIGVIPARYDSSRFPGKPLAKIAGKTMIQRVYEGCLNSGVLTRVVVATDDERIAKEVERFGGEVVMTSAEHQSGSDRLAEAVRDLDVDVVVNIQGDEPLISKDIIAKVTEPIVDGDAEYATLRFPLTAEKDINNPAIAKVIVDRNEFAIYFSRHAIPFDRDNIGAHYFKHLGIYAYTKKALLAFSKLEQTPLEKAECLEQLRLLENGLRIKAVLAPHDLFGVDFPEDVKKIESKLHGTS